MSVRSASEAVAALDGGAHILDVKEPARGPLGMASPDAWRAVRQVAPAHVPVSVALGELRDWLRPDAAVPSTSDFAGLRYRKLGLAGAADLPDWPVRWQSLRDVLGDGPTWIAVVYADWERARAPHPESVLDVALSIGCSGLLIDTWSKSHPSPLDPGPFWSGLVARARSRHLLVALAGGLHATGFARFAPLAPDLFAVRGAACSLGRRESPIDADLVARLVQAAGRINDLPAAFPIR